MICLSPHQIQNLPSQLGLLYRAFPFLECPQGFAKMAFQWEDQGQEDEFHRKPDLVNECYLQAIVLVSNMLGGNHWVLWSFLVSHLHINFMGLEAFFTKAFKNLTSGCRFLSMAYISAIWYVSHLNYVKQSLPLSQQRKDLVFGCLQHPISAKAEILLCKNTL